MPDALSAAWLGADHEARHTAAGMIRLWGGELFAYRTNGGRRLLSNIDPGGATGTRTAQQVITHHGIGRLHQDEIPGAVRAGIY